MTRSKKIGLVLISLLFIYWIPFKKKPIVIHMIGDSTMANKAPTVYPETGWGQVFNEYFDPEVRICNHAINGYSSKSFIENKRWQRVLDSLNEGDYVFIEFGHNDEKAGKPGGTTLDEFRGYLIQYVNDARAKKAIPVLLTPIMRRAFNGNQLRDTHLGYPDVIRAVAKENHVFLIDLHRKTGALLDSLGNGGSRKIFNWVDSGVNVNYPKGIRDNTHLNTTGAHKIAELAVQGIRENIPELAKYLK
jgi:pectinesterase